LPFRVSIRYTILHGLETIWGSSSNAQVDLPLPTGAYTRLIAPGRSSSIWTASERYLLPVNRLSPF